MSYISITFLAFVSIMFLLYFLLPKRMQWVVLLLSSYVFYIAAGWKFVPFLVLTTVTVFFCRAVAWQNKRQLQGGSGCTQSVAYQRRKSSPEGTRYQEKTLDSGERIDPELWHSGIFEILQLFCRQYKRFIRQAANGSGGSAA